MFTKVPRIGLAVAFALLLNGCESLGVVPDPPPPTEDRTASSSDNGGLIETLFGGDSNTGGAQSGIAVNSFLWRASLDTISFMPLNSADPFGGVIITDWYSPPETPRERVKLNIYILGRELRADGIRVSVFRQTSANRPWQEAKVDPKTVRDIENAILKRARELRIANFSAQ
ncbi:MAG: DUF3576 domain-containing protein [Alphaproteobacteria bacterium]|nr:DUF3576 domain-containing protein [Alphaproteobacteria bacterium]